MNREQIFYIPRVILVFVLGFCLCQLYLTTISLPSAQEFLFRYGFVSLSFTDFLGFNYLRTLAEGHAVHAENFEAIRIHEIAHYLVVQSSFVPGSLLTYSMIHAGWSHLIINSVSMIAFGSIVARRLGPIRFIFIYCISAIGGALTHMVFHFHDLIPLVGASAAVSGLIAASVRFVFQPGEALSGFSIGNIGEFRSPNLTVAQTFRNRKCLSFMLSWLGVNFLMGIINAPFFLGENSIAWESHLGGFFFGLVCFSFLDRRVTIER